jgi:hypothetical protein
MPDAVSPSAPTPSSYHGEVWTDAGGFATVRLPADAATLQPPIEYELRDLDPPSSARVTAELRDGHFTIATDQPHVKVAWRIRRPRRLSVAISNRTRPGKERRDEN